MVGSAIRSVGHLLLVDTGLVLLLEAYQKTANCVQKLPRDQEPSEQLSEQLVDVQATKLKPPLLLLFLPPPDRPLAGYVVEMPQPMKLPLLIGSDLNLLKKFALNDAMSWS